MKKHGVPFHTQYRTGFTLGTQNTRYDRSISTPYCSPHMAKLLDQEALLGRSCTVPFIGDMNTTLYSLVETPEG